MASTADRVSAVFGRLAQVTPGDGVVCTGAMTMLMKEMGASDKKAAKEAKATLGKTGQATVAELVSGQFGQFLLVDKPQNLAKLEKLEATLAAMTLHHDFDGCEDKKADDEGVGVLAEAAAAEAKAEADAAKVEADAAAAKAEADAAKTEADAKAEEEKAASEAKEAADKLAADTAEAEKTAAADAAAAAEAIEAKAKEEADAAATAKAAEVEAKHAADAVEAAEAKAKEDADAAEAKSKEEADAKSAADAAAAEAAEAEVAAAAAVAEEKAASEAKEAEEAAAAAAEAVETKAKENADAAATAKAAEAEEKCAADAAEAKSKADAEASAAVDAAAAAAAAAAENAAPVDDGFEDAVSGMSIKDLKKTIIEAYLTLDGCYEKSDLRHRAVEGLRKQAAEDGAESKGSTPSSPKFKRKRYTVLFEAFPIGFGIHATDEDGHVGVSSVAAGGKAAAANVRKNDVVAFVNYADMEGQTAKEVLTTLKACAKSKKPLAITFEKVVAHDGF